MKTEENSMFCVIIGAYRCNQPDAHHTVLTDVYTAGQISFKEFLYAVQNWVLDEDDYEGMPSDDEREEALAAKTNAMERLRLSDNNSSLKSEAGGRQFISKPSIKKHNLRADSSF